MSRRPLAAAALALALGGQGCQKADSAPLYEKVPVERRDIVVAAIATGVIRPTLTFSVKSKAWGEIVEMPVQTGEEVKQGQLLARIDPRLPQNNLSQAQASLDKARAQLQNATEQLKRSEALYGSQAIAETDYDQVKLAYATAQAAVVTAEANFQTAKDAMEDTQVRAPITGTVLELDAVLGSVISSPTLGGGTVILKMANLDTAVDSVLIVETDIGRVQPGLAATITVDAFANRSFEGSVAKIVPQALVSQNVTMFPVLLTIQNPGHVLKPGMNTRVNIHTGLRQAVLAVPNAALRTARDVDVGASVLGLDPQTVEQQLTAAQAVEGPARTGGDTAVHADSAKARAAAPQGAGATFTMPNGRSITLPPGVTAEQVQAALTKMRSGATPTSAERALLAQLRSQFQKGAGGGSQRSGQNTSYIVFALRAGKILPVPIKTGLTDQDYIEVRSGLTDKDTVLVLPSASLVQSQQQFRQRFQNVTGGGLPGVRQQQQQAPSRSAPGR